MSALLSPREYQLGLIAELRQIEARTRERSAQAEPLFTQREQLLPRERVARLLDPGTPWLELSTLAGWLQDLPDPALSVPGGGAIVGIGMVSGTWVMLVADDSGIDAGALQALGIEKFQRAQAIALQNKLPFVHLVESAGANLLKYKVEQFVLGGGNFHGLARLSAAGIPVLSVVHGSSTAGGAYMTGLADQVIMVRGRGRAFLAGPPLLKAATGEIADDETLGGTDMHASVSGLVEHVAEDDAHALGIARQVVAHWGWQPSPRVGIISNNGPLDPAGSNKITHFIQTCDQTGVPLVWLHNTTGFMVGKEAEHAGMIKHGSKQIQALSNARVAQITVICGASFGAGNYGMCGRAFGPRFVFSWPNARTAVMGPQQAADTMGIVMEEAAARKGTALDTQKRDALKQTIVNTFERQMSAFYTSGLLLDDGVIDPRDTRQVLSLTLSLCKQAEQRTLRPMQYGVSRT
ncbi:MAG: acyl-CoA carboxylase subunit beta [Betaproteobacteria bacterium]|nr:acyl-CoA carboxylase subunit beta [Betaproteobacteria bacterium]